MMCTSLRRMWEEVSLPFALFLASMGFACFSKAMGGAYMKSSITQIERRFDIASSHSGAIDGSFEMGNLLAIAFVSYFGAHFHRPRLIAIGLLVMGLGSLLTALPHFFQGEYRYETSVSYSSSNNTGSISPCMANHITDGDGTPDIEAIKACEKATGSSMWIIVFVGNMLRGLGETPIMPLGLSYMDDFCSEANSPLFLAFIQTVGILGPMVGFVLGSYLSKIYVDVGSVDLKEVSITYKDSRWVGAWWIGFIVTGTVIILSSIPFWFMPRSLTRPGEQQRRERREEEAVGAEGQNFLPLEVQNPRTNRKFSFREMARDFFPSVKRLFSNQVFNVYILTSLVMINGFVGLITFKPKYIEQVFGQAPSKAIFYIGIMNLPAVALGVLCGGIFLKRMNMGVVGAVRLGMATALGSACLLSTQFFIHCENTEVAGLTVNYQGFPNVSSNPLTLLSQCNMGCSCSLKQWDPVCAQNGMTYASPCLAGCQYSSGTNMDMVFHNCTCVTGMNATFPDLTTTLGQCPRNSNCDFMFKIFMALSVVGSFVSAFGGVTGYVVLFRTVHPSLKSLAVGMQMLIVRTLGGIPPPIYFGALIDQTCLKWGTKQCGGVGACRIYDAHSFRVRYMGLISCLYLLSCALWGVLYKCILIRERTRPRPEQARPVEGESETGETTEAHEEGNGHAVIYVAGDSDDLDRESAI